MRPGVLAALGLALVAGVEVGAQPGGPVGRGQGRAPNQRAELETDVRREFARVVQKRVGLTDDQMARLGPLTRKYEEQRRQTQVDERNTRIRLQAALLDSTAADTTKINLYLQQMLDTQKRRIAIAEAEQKDLATIMSPLQRARYLGLQEQVRRRLELMRTYPGASGNGGAPGQVPLDSARRRP